MKNQKTTKFLTGTILLAAFALWTAAVCHVDVQAIGPNGSTVGLSTMNRLFHRLTGVHLFLYTLTDWLSLIPLALATGFAILGLAQWFQRRNLLNVDRDILILGSFYLVVIAAYMLFECAAVNSRPVLINGVLEASYPSSTTMLVLCIMSTSRLQLKARIRHGIRRRWILLFISAFAAFMVIGRLVSGVHWLSDIIGGALLSAGLVRLYEAFSGLPDM